MLSPGNRPDHHKGLFPVRNSLGQHSIGRFMGNVLLAGEKADPRAALVGIEKGRERTIHIGALILERFLYALKAEGSFVSVRGWRHGMIETDSYWNRSVPT